MFVQWADEQIVHGGWDGTVHGPNNVGSLSLWLISYCHCWIDKLSMAATSAGPQVEFGSMLKLDPFNLGGGSDLIPPELTQFWIWICFPTYSTSANTTIQALTKYLIHWDGILQISSDEQGNFMAKKGEATGDLPWNLLVSLHTLSPQSARLMW